MGFFNSLGKVIERSAAVHHSNGEEISTANGLPVQMANSKYIDFDIVVEGTNMAAGVTVNGIWLDDLSWVRNVLIFAQSDQQYDIILHRRDKNGNIDFGTSLTTNQAASPSASRPHVFSMQNTSGHNILGHSARFSIKNSSATANTFARVRVQLMGL